MTDMLIPHLEREYRIHVYETDPDEKVNLYSLFNYMQDIAAQHAIKLGYSRDELMKDNHFWVLSRMYAVISDRPSRDESIIVKTWPCGTDHMFALRYYEIRRPDGRIIANASSSWLIIDHSTKRIQRPDELLTRLNSEVRSGNAPVRCATKLEGASENGQYSPEFPVKLSDLDVNLHTNNASYLKWIIDSYDPDFIMTHVPSSVEINYIAESIFGEKIMIRTSNEEGNKTIFRHSVIRSNDMKELCRIRLEWKEGSTKKVKQL